MVMPYSKALPIECSQCTNKTSSFKLKILEPCEINKTRYIQIRKLRNGTEVLREPKCLDIINSHSFDERR